MQPIALLERALDWCDEALAAVDVGDLARRTPCVAWDLAALVDHLDDAVVAFTEAAGGRVRVTAPVGPPAPGPATVAVVRARREPLLEAWAHRSAVADAPVALDDQALDGAVLLHLAALEVAVHADDVARTVHRAGALAWGGGAAGRSVGIPDGLARDLLPAARLLVPGAGRAGRFAPPRAVGPGAGPAHELRAWLGR